MSAIELQWIFGLNQDIPGGFHNLTDDNNKKIFYVTANNGIIYDYQNKTQLLLQGHRNEITANCVSSNRKWIVTGDAGPDSLIVVWDAEKGVPIKTILEPHNKIGTAALDISSDCKYLFSVSAGMPQTLSVWDWTVPGEDPLFEIEIDSEDFQSCLKINPDDSGELLTNGHSTIFFYLWDRESGIQQISPNSHSREFNFSSLHLTESIFIPGTTQAISGTSDGQVILWDQKDISNISVLAERGHREAIKYIRLHSSAINCIQSAYKSFIVTGGDEGFIRIFDLKLKIFVQLERIKKGPISFISASNYSKYENQDKNLELMIVSKNGGVHLVKDITELTKAPEVISLMQQQAASVYAMDCHPKKPQISIGGSDGTLHIWNYETKEKISELNVPDGHFTCLKYSPNGTSLGAGYSNGTISFFDSETLQSLTKTPFLVSKRASILEVTFSHNGKYCACFDSEHAVALFSGAEGNGWNYVGKYRIHSKPISALIFSPATKDNFPLRLLSFSEDRHMVEFDLPNSTTELKIKSRRQLEQTAKIMGGSWYFSDWNSSEKYVVTTNSHYKIRLYRQDTLMCRYTFLCPTYGGPLRGLKFLPQAEDRKTGYLFFNTDEKVIGMIKTPMDGNPYRNVGIIAHPGQICATSYSGDGKHVFIAGGKDYAVSMWNVKTEVLDKQTVAGGQGYEPFIQMLEGGNQGSLYRQMEDLFYFSQIKTQGVKTQKPRITGNTVSISEVPYIFQALGFFPSEFDIQNILNEIKYSKVLESGTVQDAITLDEIIKVYVNHRPIVEDTYDFGGHLANALASKDGSKVLKNDLVTLLQTHGEYMDADEFNSAVSLVLQEIEKNLESSLVILPVPKPVSESIDLKEIGQKILPHRDSAYLGSLDVEEKGQEIQANAPIGREK